MLFFIFNLYQRNFKPEKRKISSEKEFKISAMKLENNNPNNNTFHSFGDYVLFHDNYIIELIV
jgi:hypothetical protein